jgi:DNA topoisomerase-1
LALRMISLTGLRNGGEDGGGKVEAFGASNLRPDQCRVEGDKVHLDFTGKKGVEQRHTFEDSTLARHIAAKQKENASRVFDGDADKTLDYLKKISSDKFKVHDFRTWHGTMLADATAAKIAAKGEAPQTEKEFKSFQKRVSKVVARQLGNDPGMALKAYIHPEVFTPYHPSGGSPVRKKAA